MGKSINKQKPKKIEKVTVEEHVQAFQDEYTELCKKYGLVHVAIPFDTNTAQITAKLQIAKLT